MTGRPVELTAREFDLLYYFADSDAKVRPYIAGGIGVKYYQGFGTEDLVIPTEVRSNLELSKFMGRGYTAEADATWGKDSMRRNASSRI